MTEPRTRRSLSRERIVDAALELVEEDGIDAVTIRAVAERCGVGAMTLYTYVNTKEELMSAVAGRLLESVARPEPGTLDWREEIVAVFRSAHQVFLDHPELARIVASQPVDGVAAYRGAEVVLAALRRAGLSDDDAVAAFDALSSYTIGFTQRELSRLETYVPPADRLAEIRTLSPEEFPHVRDMAEPMVARDSSRNFDRGLQVLIRGIAEGLQ